MGPTLLLDKSAIQSISLDESVWLDMFFGANITPLLYIETLADLEKADKIGRSGDEIVRDLAGKTPANATFPNAHHHELLIVDLLGYTPPLGTHQVPVNAGQVKRDPDGKVGVHFDQFPEQVALNCWHKGEFTDVERSFARKWRDHLSTLNPTEAIACVEGILPAGRRFSDITQIKQFAYEFAAQPAGLSELNFELKLLGVPSDLWYRIQRRYITAGQPALIKFAPYAAHVLKVELFFHLCLRQDFISPDRASNKVDIAYLYYLPFCHAFVSKDKLHIRTAELFMDYGQAFVNAAELKAGLAELNAYFTQFKEEIEQVGVMSYAGYPPTHLDNVVTRLWDQFMRPDWRKIQQEQKPKEDQTEHDAKLVARLRQQHEKSQPIKGPVGKDAIEYGMITRMVSVQRGSWRMVRPGLENEKVETK